MATQAKIAKLAIGAALQFANILAILHPGFELLVKKVWKAHFSIPFFIVPPKRSFRLFMPFENCKFCIAAMGLAAVIVSTSGNAIELRMECLYKVMRNFF